MTLIRTPEDWWRLLDNHWAEIYNILCRFINLTEMATDVPGDLTTNVIFDGEIPMIQSQDIVRSKERRDHWRLLRYLNGAWHNAPDKPYIHEIPGWGVLCDLCSEEDVFDELDREVISW